MELAVLLSLLLNQQQNQQLNQYFLLMTLRIHHFKVMIIFVHLLLQHHYMMNYLYNVFLIYQYNIHLNHIYRNSNHILKHNNYSKDYNIIINLHFNFLYFNMIIPLLHLFIKKYNYIIFMLLNHINQNKPQNHQIIYIINVFLFLYMHRYNYPLLYIKDTSYHNNFHSY